MLRDTSEIAVAITVRSLPAKPTSAARSRPRCRAITTSASRSIGMRMSSATIAPRLEPLLQCEQALVEIERRRDAAQRQAKLHHGERDVGLNADDDGFGAA